ncbi:MAG: hypothetical protein TIS_01976 [Tissierella sp.]
MKGFLYQKELRETKNNAQFTMHNAQLKPKDPKAGP